MKSRLILALTLFFKLAFAADLPLLPGNRLLVGEDRFLPNSTRIDCVKGARIDADFKTSRILSVDAALTQVNFGQYSVTAQSMSCRPVYNLVPQRYTVAEVKYTTGLIITTTVTAYALQVDPKGTLAYWLPQGGSIDIPKNPTADQPKYVFTPDFSGCSWTVTPMSNGNLRLRHVQGGKENQEFNDYTDLDKGGSISYAMQFRDYGYIVTLKELVDSSIAFAYMQYSNGAWNLHLQRQTCAPRPGNCVYKDGLIDAMKMFYFNQDTYKMVTNTQSFRIPQ